MNLILDPLEKNKILSEEAALNLSNDTIKIYQRTTFFCQTIKNFSHWKKKIMINYLNILKNWDVIEKAMYQNLT
jgi:hypothetical protein